MKRDVVPLKAAPREAPIELPPPPSPAAPPPAPPSAGAADAAAAEFPINCRMRRRSAAFEVSYSMESTTSVKLTNMNVPTMTKMTKKTSDQNVEPPTETNIIVCHSS